MKRKECVVNMKYPNIDREQVSFESDTEVCNIGYYEGTLDDDRPIRVEVWSSYGILNATIFISNIDLEKLSEKEIKQYLEKNNIIKVIEDKILITEIEDVNDNKFLSINVPIESNYDKINEYLVRLKDYDL